MGGDAEIPGKIYPDVLSEARNACYKARDAFYACIEKEVGKNYTECGYAGLLYPAECSQSRSEYTRMCRPAWVKHFDKLVATNTKVKRLLDDGDSRKGPISLPQPFTFKS
ncbi:cytochrome c oxidase, subunit Vib family protein [Wolffia australiana]